MWNWSGGLLTLLTFTLPVNLFALQCSRYPSNTLAAKSPVDENFVLSITGNAQTYLLGQSYNITLQSYNGRRFMSASVVLENSEGDRVFNDDMGQLEVVDPNETKYSLNCSNMIETTNMNYKTRIDMVWIAPSEPGKGCVLIRATVLQHRDVWYMDDGALTKQVCEEPADDLQSQLIDEEGKPCCACDEARYEITVEGTWSRNLHPKDFPTKGWLTRFSDIMGAAHTSDYRFWASGAFAIPEMREFAQYASTRGLERELNRAFKEEKVRTILKARGPAYPNMNTPSVASVRVDPWHHQFSIASKIVPSPDWIIGVSGLELCQRNCTWLEETTVNLYPWDVGTDAGPSYTSPAQPQVPADVIRRISSQSPADIRSPFFDETGVPMKPMATLTIKRQRLYDRKCIEEDSNNPDDLARECHTHPWTEWSKCSTNCGQGTQYRLRVFKQPDVAVTYNCDTIVENRQERPCVGPCTNDEAEMIPTGDEESQQYGSMGKLLKSGRITAADCRLGDWGEWLPCNATCGAGFKIRQRELLDQNPDEECMTLEERFEYVPCFNRQCTGSRRSNIPEVGSYQGVGDYRGNRVDQEEQQAGNRGRYYPRYNTQYERDDDRMAGRGREDSTGYNNHYKSKPYQPRDRENPYDTTEIDQQPPFNYPYGQEGDQIDYGRQQTSRQRNRYDKNEYDPNAGTGDAYDYNRPQSQKDFDYNRPKYPSPQYSKLNRRPFNGPDMEGQDDIYNAQRYGPPNNDLDDPLETFGKPYNFPAESLKQEAPKTGMQFAQPARSGGDFQYLNSPVKDTLLLVDAESLPSPDQTSRQRNPSPRSNLKLEIASELKLPRAPTYCYQPLIITDCSDRRTIGNFWFYNHCTDECMLYAVDICDHNMNRFPSLELCEEQCAAPARMNSALLLKKQQTAAHCQTEGGRRPHKGQVM